MAVGDTYNIDHVANEIRRLRAAGVAQVCLLVCTAGEPDSSSPPGTTTHAAVLRKAAHLFLISLRATDLVVRVADDRFAVLLSNADHSTGYRVRQRLWEQAAMLNLESGPPLLELQVDVYSGPPVARRLCRHLTQSPGSHVSAAVEGPDGS